MPGRAAVRRRSIVPVVVLLLATLATFARAGATTSREPAASGDTVPRVAFVARADNPVDALAAAAIAGTLGAPVFLSFPPELSPDAAEGLQAYGPDLVVVAGGTGALSERVEADIDALGFEVQRVWGESRTSTAVALAEFATDLGVGRPLVTGGAVAGDADLAGRLSAEVLSSTTTAGAPFTVASSAVVAGLNADLLDGMDATQLRAGTLAALTCADGQVAKYDVAGSGWTCADDAMGTGGGGDGDTLATLACSDGQVAKWNSSGGAWVCGDDVDTDTDTDTLASLGCTDGELPKFSSGAWTCGTDLDTDTDTLAALSCAQGQAPILGTGDTWMCATFLTLADLDTDTDGKVDVDKLGTAGLACPLGEALIGFLTDGSLSCTPVVLPDPEPARPDLRVTVDGREEPGWTAIEGGGVQVDLQVSTGGGTTTVAPAEPSVKGPTLRGPVPSGKSDVFRVAVQDLPDVQTQATRVVVEDLTWAVIELPNDADPWRDWTVGDHGPVAMTITASLAPGDAPVTQLRQWWEDFAVDRRSVEKAIELQVATLTYTFGRCVPVSWSALEFDAQEVVDISCFEVTSFPASDPVLAWVADQLAGDTTPHDVVIDHLDGTGSIERRFSHPGSLIQVYQFPVLDLSATTVAPTHGVRLVAQQQDVS